MRRYTNPSLPLPLPYCKCPDRLTYLHSQYVEISQIYLTTVWFNKRTHRNDRQLRIVGCTGSAHA